MLHVSLRQLEYVVAVGRRGSLSAAAEALNVSQPALSVAIAHVERRLGQVLFLRRKGVAIAPTPKGRLFLKEAEALLEGAARLERLGEAPAPAQSRVVLAILDELAPRWLAPILALVRTTFPQTEMRALTLPFERLTEALLSGQAEIGLTYDLGLDAGFRRDLLVSAVPRIWVTPDDALAGCNTVSLTQIADRPLILSDQALSIQHMMGLFRRIGATPHIRHRAASIDLLRSLAANGEGTGLSYTHAAGTVSPDGLPITNVPISDAFAAEPIVLTCLAALPEPLNQIHSAILRLR